MKIASFMCYGSESRRSPLLTIMALLAIFSCNARAEPAIINFWLVDADTGERVHQLGNIARELMYQTTYLPTMPEKVTVEAEASDDTQSVKVNFYQHRSGPAPGTLITSETVNSAPYTVEGGNTPVMLLRDVGNFFIEVTPYGSPDLEGEIGSASTFNLTVAKPDIFVNSTEDTGDYDPGDGLCSTRHPSTYDLEEEPETIDYERVDCTLRAAIEEANAQPDSQWILVDGRRGEFKLEQGQLLITDHINLTGHELPKIDAQHNSRIFKIEQRGVTVKARIEGFELHNGKPDPGAPPFVASGNGGAIELKGPSQLILHSSILQNNEAQDGGAIYVDHGELDVSNSLFIDNRAGEPLPIEELKWDPLQGEGEGGAIYNLGGKVEINQSSLVDNHAETGGAIYSEGDGALITLISSTLAHNKAARYGGAVGSRAPSELRISFSTLVYNSVGNVINAELGRIIPVRGGGVWGGGSGGYWSKFFMGSSIIADNDLGSYAILDIIEFVQEFGQPWEYQPDCAGGVEVEIEIGKSMSSNVVGVGGYGPSRDFGCPLDSAKDDIFAVLSGTTPIEPINPKLSPQMLLSNTNPAIPHLVYVPTPDSPAVGHGNAEMDLRGGRHPEVSFMCPTFDQIGNPRLRKDQNGDGFGDLDGEYEPICNSGAIDLIMGEF